MRLTPDVALVGGGSFGFDLVLGSTATSTCSTAATNSPWSTPASAAASATTDRILANVAADGYDPGRISRLFLTHYHADHAGGAAEMRERLG